MRLDFPQRHLPHTQILRRRVAIGVIALVGGGGEDRVAGVDGHEARVARPEGPAAGGATGAEGDGAEGGAEDAHCEVGEEEVVGVVLGGLIRKDGVT
jgi:hypothetical protein